MLSREAIDSTMTEEERAAIEDGIYLYVRSLSDMGILEEVITLES
jgi:hypothetical protein